MKVLFCKVASMKYYKGACEDDVPYNGGSFVKENGTGMEEYNFEPVKFDNGEFCFGYVETKKN